MLNYMQTSMLEILSIIYETPISDLKCLKESDGIYQIATSPNIQSISVTNNRNAISSNEKFDLLHEWRWAAVRKTSSILIYKLVTPTLGYAFGGSRFESEFVDKKLRLHDCSSFVSEVCHSSNSGMYRILHIGILASLILRSTHWRRAIRDTGSDQSSINAMCTPLRRLGRQSQEEFRRLGRRALHGLTDPLKIGHQIRTTTTRGSSVARGMSR